jgi:hypothetical protein
MRHVLANLTSEQASTLQHAVRVFTGDPYLVQEIDGRYWLSGPDLDAADKADLPKAVKRAAVFLNAVTMLGRGPVDELTPGNEVRVEDDAGANRSISRTYTVRVVRADPDASTELGRGMLRYWEAEAIARLAGLRIRNPHVRAVLDIWAAPDIDFRDLYVVWELVQDSMIGFLGRYGEDLVICLANMWPFDLGALNWFRATANSYWALGPKARHGWIENATGDPPRKRMPLSQAYEVVESVLKCWLEYLCNVPM